MGNALHTHARCTAASRLGLILLLGSFACVLLTEAYRKRGLRDTDVGLSLDMGPPSQHPRSSDNSVLPSNLLFNDTGRPPPSILVLRSDNDDVTDSGLATL